MINSKIPSHYVKLDWFCTLSTQKKYGKETADFNFEFAIHILYCNPVVQNFAEMMRIYIFIFAVKITA